MRTAPPWIGMREGFARGRTKRAKGYVFGAAAIIDLLSGSLGRSGLCLHQGPTRVALCTHWPHFVETDYTTARSGLV